MPWVMVMVTAMASSRKGGVPEPGKLLDLGQQLQLIVVCFSRCFRRPRPAAASFLLRFDFRDDCICMVGLVTPCRAFLQSRCTAAFVSPSASVMRRCKLNLFHPISAVGDSSD